MLYCLLLPMYIYYCFVAGILRFLYCSVMGMEVTDIRMDKESECVIIYPKDVSQDSDHESIPSDNSISESYGDVNGDHEAKNLEDSTEIKEYEVKECTNENKSQLCDNENSNGEPNMVSSDLGGDQPVEKVHLDCEKTKDQNKSRLSVNCATKPAAGNVKTKLTIPQPFALATEKRASVGPRPAGAVPDAGNGMNKSSKTNNLHLSTVKKNQVTDLTGLTLLFYVFDLKMLPSSTILGML